MANVLRAGREWLAQQRVEQLSELVTYARGAHSVLLQAVLAKAQAQTELHSGFALSWDKVAFTLRASDLVLNGVVTLPLAGDEIAVVLAGRLHRYRVRPPESSETPYQLADGTGQCVQVHAVLMSLENTL